MRASVFCAWRNLHSLAETVFESVVSLAGVQQALEHKFPGGLGEANSAAAAEAYRGVIAQQEADRQEVALSDATTD